jgi:hypothetical protein
MKPKLLLRIASIILLIFTCGHTFGHLTRKNISDPKGLEVMKAMEGYHFNFRGVMQTYDGHMEGYGLDISFILAALSIILWIISGESARAPKFCKKLLFPILFFMLGNAYVAYKYFFHGPTVFSLLISLLLIIAILQLHKTGNAA